MFFHSNHLLHSEPSRPAAGSAMPGTSPAVESSGALREAAHLLASAERVEELANRLVAPGPKAAHISASETHELAKFVHAAVSVLRSLHTGSGASALNSPRQEHPGGSSAPLGLAPSERPATARHQKYEEAPLAAGASDVLERLRAAHAVEDLTVVARLYTTGCPPGRRYRRASTQPGPGELLCLSSDAALAVRKKDLHIGQLERLAVALQQIRTPANEISLLAAEHRGLRVDYCGFLEHVRQALQQGAREPALAEMVQQLQAHLREMGQRWYANEVAVVDELLQLYCIESDARAALAAGAQRAPRPPASDRVSAKLSRDSNHEEVDP